MAAITQPRSFGGFTGRRYGSFAGKASGIVAGPYIVADVAIYRPAFVETPGRTKANVWASGPVDRRVYRPGNTDMEIGT